MDYRIAKMFHLSLLLVSVFCQDVFNTMPPPVNTNFSCRGRDTGFYADVETNCRVYHTCDDHGNKFTYYCPAETAFRQEALVCDHAHLVDCARGRRVSTLRSNDESREGNAAARARSDAAGSLANRKSSNADAALGEARHTAGRSSDIFQSANSNPSYTRSFRITAEPQSSTPKSFKHKQPTFVLSSSVFLRDRVNFQKALPGSQNNRVATESSKTFGSPSDYQARKADKKEDEEEFFARTSASTTSATTFRPFGADFNVTGNFRSPGSDDNEDETGGFFGKVASPISSTTFKPSAIDLKVKGDTAEVPRNAQNPTGSQIRRLDTEESMDSFPASKFSTSKSTTTFRPFGAGFKVKPGTSDVPGFGKTKFEYQDDGKGDGSTGSGTKLDDEEVSVRKTGDGFRFEGKGRNDERAAFADKFGAPEVDKDSGKSKTLANERPSFFADGSNFPYYETLRSMQAGNNKSSPPNSSTVRSFVSATTSAPAVTAGTEFPVHAFTGSLSPLMPNELEDDPYYPRRSTTTEVYYKLTDRDKIGNKLFRFSTRRPWPGSLDFEIPEVLPDLNTLDDLVDRRKHFYIPRVKAT